MFTAAGIDFQTDPGLSSVLFRLLKGIVAWFLMVGIMGLGGSFRSAKTEDRGGQEVREPSESDRKSALVERAAEYLREAVLPIYVLHLIFVIVIGFYVMQWTSSMWARFLVITVASTVGTLAAYDIVRRTPLTRFLFGMRLRGAVSPPLGAERRTAGGWLRANLPHLSLWSVAALATVLIVLAANRAAISPVGRWKQTYDTAQAATGYIAEFREDGTWTVSAEGESIEGTYDLPEDGQIRITYPDGTVSTAEYRISADRFGLISADRERQQVFLRLQ
jgi:hypothetical protein